MAILFTIVQTKVHAADSDSPTFCYCFVSYYGAGKSLKIYMVMKLQGLLKEKREDILRIATRHGAHNVRVFGSAARGSTHFGSDVDFLVDMDRGRSLLDMGGLLMDLRDLLGCEVDVVTVGGLKPRIRERVLEEAVPL
jgi:hypothetical protein